MDILIIRPIEYEAELKQIKNEISEIIIYPNPANTYISFIDQVNPELNYELTVIDLKGAVVMEFKEAVSGKAIDITSLATGLYCVTLVSQINAQTFHLLIAR